MVPPVHRHRRSLVPALSALLVFLLLGLTSCALFNPGKGLKSCRYTYRSLAFASVDKERTYWVVDVGVVNPNVHPVTLEKMRFSLVHGKDTLLTGWNPAKKAVAAGDSTILQSTLELPHAALQRLPPSLLANTNAEFTLIGDAFLQTWVGEVHVQDALKKTIHVNMPEQVAKVRNLFMKHLFPGFGFPAPRPSDPRQPLQPPSPLSPGANPDEPL